MGAYLSSPNCDKDIVEQSNGHLSHVAGSMQGWRMSQEDAHNAILNFDDKTSFFAVYDGHGGSEIAVYCSQNLPEFIKKLTAYKEGRLNDALIEGFLKFDSILLDAEVKKVLQQLANDENENKEQDEQSNEEFNIEETELLKEEAQLPIQHILKQYNEEQITNATLKEDIIVSSTLSIQSETKTKINEDENSIETVVDENMKKITDENPSSSSESISLRKRQRKPVLNSLSTPLATIFQSNSLTRHLLSDNTDELEENDDDDSEFAASDEETSGDEGEDNNSDDEEEEEDEEGEDDDDDSSETNNTIEIRKLMKKSILSILTRSTTKNSNDDNVDGDDLKENQNDDENDDEDDGDDDLNMFDMENDPGSSSGCTAIVGLLRDKQLFVANVGDSRCVVCREGRVVEMSVDHKPEDPEERKRIEKAGFKVTSDGRVSGGLNLSRAIGDHAYKKICSLTPEEQAITALPDVRKLTLDDKDEFMVIACDGIWNSMSSQDVIDFVRFRLNKKTLTQICDELFMHCLAPNTHGDGTGCDNMTAIIVKFNTNSQSIEISSPKSNQIKRSLSPENSNNKKMKICSTE